MCTKNILNLQRVSDTIDVMVMGLWLEQRNLQLRLVSTCINSRGCHVFGKSEKGLSELLLALRAVLPDGRKIS